MSGSNASRRRAVVDSNMLSDPSLRRYLALPSKPLVVLPDYAGIEAYQAKDPIAGMAKSLEIIGDYPEQVLVLKTTPKILALRPRLAGMQRRMIDEDSTNNFAIFCRNVRAEAAAPGAYRQQLLDLAKDATEFGAKGLIDTAPKIGSSTRDLWDEYSAREKEILRRRLPRPPALIQKIAGHVSDISEQAFEDLGVDASRVSGDQVLNSFILRYTLCCYMRTQEWMIAGNIPGPRQARNSVIDCGFVTYATYFDDFLTNDKGAAESYRQIKSFLVEANR